MLPPTIRPVLTVASFLSLLATASLARAADPRWSRPQVLAQRHLSDGGPAAAIDGRRIYLYGIQRDRFSLDGGKTWTPVGPSGLSPETKPALVFAKGSLHEVLLTYPGSMIVYRRTSVLGGPWKALRRLDRRQGRTTDFAEPSLAVDGETVYVAWDSCISRGFSLCDSNRTYMVVRRDAKSRWSRNREVDLGTSPVLAAEDGVLHAVSRGLVYRRSFDLGRTFTEPIALTGPTDFGSDPAISAAGNRLAVAWSGPIPGGGYERDIFVTSSADGGETWSAPKRVLHTSGRSSGADIEILADRLLLAWGEANSGDRRVFFTESADWGESWSSIRRFKTGARTEPIWHEPALAAADGRVHLFYPVSLPGQLERLVYRHRPLD